MPLWRKEFYIEIIKNIIGATIDVDMKTAVFIKKVFSVINMQQSPFCEVYSKALWRHSRNAQVICFFFNRTITYISTN